MKEQVEKLLTEQNIIGGSGVVVGLSGGADSVCLLLVLSELAKAHGLPLYAVHVNHGIRTDGAAHDESFSRTLCERLGVPLKVYRVNIPEEARKQGIGEEEAGRQARYRLFREFAEECGADTVAVAHHRDDNAETVLFRICRGTGIHGLTGIPFCSRPFAESDIRLIRPLIQFSREDILTELSKRGEAYCVDETNAEDTYTRNYIRNEVFPMLTRINNGAIGHLATLAEQAVLFEELLAAESNRLYEEAVCGEILLREQLAKAPTIVRREVILRFIKSLAGAEKDITEKHVLLTEELLFGAVSRELCLPYDVILLSTYEGVRRKRATEGSDEVVVLQSGTYPLGDGRKLSVTIRPYTPGEPIVKNRWNKWLDYDMINSAPVLRTRRPGDYFIINREGGRKSLQDYFVEAKLPKSERDSIPVIALGEEILWVPGYRGTERYLVTARTKRILTFEMMEA